VKYASICYLMLSALCADAADSGGFYAFDELPDKLSFHEPLDLSIEDCVLRAIEANYDISIRRLSAQIAEARVLDAHGEFEPEFFAETGQSSTSDTNGTTKTDNAEIGIRTRIATGADISLSADHGKANDETTGEGGAAVRITQPLLRGGGFKATRAPLVIAGRNKDISVHDLEEQMLSTALSVQKSYWSLAAALERLKVQKESLKFAEDLSQLTLQRADAGIMSESDTVEAQAAVYARRADVARAEESVRGIEDILKESLALLERPEYWTAPVIPATSPQETGSDLDFLELLRVALENRPDYRAELLRLENADLSLYVARNDLLPALGLTAAGGRDAKGNSLGTAFDAISDDDEETWSVFLNLTLPLGNKEARAARDEADLEREQQLLKLKRLEVRIIREVRRAVDAVNTSRRVVESARRAVEFEQRKLDNERAKLDLGKSTTDNVVRYIQSLNGARLRSVQAIIDYNQALARASRVQGITLKQYGVTIE